MLVHVFRVVRLLLAWCGMVLFGLTFCMKTDVERNSAWNLFDRVIVLALLCHIAARVEESHESGKAS